MPRVVMAVEAFLQSLGPAHPSGDRRTTVVACLLFFLAFAFGWRDDTCSHLLLPDIEPDWQLGVLYLSEEFCKGSFARARHLYRRLELNFCGFPGLEFALRSVLTISPPFPSDFLSVLGPRKRRLEAALRRVLDYVPGASQASSAPLTAHCIRVGTTTTLAKLGLSEP